MHLFHIPQCTIQNRNVHISVLNGALWDMEQVHCGICEIGLLQVQDIDLIMNSQKTLHISFLCASYGASFVNILKENDPKFQEVQQNI